MKKVDWRTVGELALISAFCAVNIVFVAGVIEMLTLNASRFL